MFFSFAYLTVRALLGLPVIAGLSRPGSVAVGFERRALRLDPEHVDWNRRGTADRALGEASQARGACTAPRA